MIATHLGIVDEEQIDNMSYLFFEDVLSELGHKLIYDAIVNYAGNSFCKDSWDMISDNNPFNVSDDKNGNGGAMKSLASFFGSSDVNIIKSKKGKGDNDGNKRE